MWGHDIVPLLVKLREMEDGLADNLDAALAGAVDGSNTSHLFRVFWASVGENGSRYDRLCRFFRILAAGWDKTYTLRFLPEDTSDSSEMTPLDDLAAMSAAGALVTDASEDTPDWTEEDPMCWYVRANARSLSDGAMDVLAVEGEDAAFDVTGELAPVYAFALALWRREWSDESYEYKSWRAQSAENYVPYAGDVAPDNTRRDMTWHPCFSGGLDAHGALTSGAGKAQCNFKSGEDGIALARAQSAYEGLWCDCDSRWLLDMWQLRHWNLENSGILEGCTDYNLDYTLAVAETGVERVIVTAAQGANFIEGSTVTVSDATRAATGVAVMARIRSVEEVEIEGVAYTALNLDNGGTTFDTTTSLHVATMPWHSGTTEDLPGHKDGSPGSLTSGKYPARVAGVEVLAGAYSIGLDPLYSVTKSGSVYNYAVYECQDSEKLAGSVTQNYRDTGIVKTGVASRWSYVRAFVRTNLGILFPAVFGGGSSVRYKSAFYGTSSAGVRCPWRFGHLNAGGVAGLACEGGGNSPSSGHWNGVPRLAGAGKKRGEWAA